MDGPIYHLENVVRDRKEDMKDFVGPLDLILHLLSKNKIEVHDISVTQILDQYMEWVEKRQELDLEVASEFITMASHLLYIKTRMLVSSQDEEALSEMEQLIASLEERQRHENYQRIKLGIAQMMVLFSKGSAFIPRPPEPLPDTGQRFDYTHEGKDLLRGIERIMKRSKRKIPPPMSMFRGVVGREPYSVERKVEEVLVLLRDRKQLSLAALWQESESRSEVVAVFIAVLELCKTGQIAMQQEDEDGEISLCLSQAGANHTA